MRFFDNVWNLMKNLPKVLKNSHCLHMGHGRQEPPKLEILWKFSWIINKTSTSRIFILCENFYLQKPFELTIKVTFIISFYFFITNFFLIYWKFWSLGRKLTNSFIILCVCLEWGNWFKFWKFRLISASLVGFSIYHVH